MRTHAMGEQKRLHNRRDELHELADLRAGHRVGGQEAAPCVRESILDELQLSDGLPDSVSVHLEQRELSDGMQARERRLLLFAGVE
jgi:hypothetical protein